jgi:hypothetical protein
MNYVDESWLKRIDAHLERSNELFERNERAFERFVEADERNTAAFERNTAAFERSAVAFERWESQQDDMREFMREITRRVEAAGREHSRAIRRMSDEIVAELQAGRGALLAILDRLQPGDSGSAA